MTAGSHDDKANIENSVRAAAMAAAKGVHLSESVLQNIIAETNGPGLSIADRIARASSMAEQYVAAPKPVNYLSATPAQLAAQAKQEGINGRVVNGVWVHGAAASRGGNQFADLKDAGAQGGVSTSIIADYVKQYNGMGLTSEAINIFAAVRLGAADFRELERSGLNSREIIAAARDTKAIGLTGKDDIVHAHYADAAVKNHLKRASRAHTKGDSDAEKRAVDDANRANAAIADANKKHHGGALIDDYKKAHGLVNDASLKAQSEAQKKEAAISVFEKSQQRFKTNKSLDF